MIRSRPRRYCISLGGGVEFQILQNVLFSIISFVLSFCLDGRRPTAPPGYIGTLSLKGPKSSAAMDKYGREGRPIGTGAFSQNVDPFLTLII